MRTFVYARGHQKRPTVSTASQPSPGPADTGTATVECAHCGEQIRPCRGETTLPKWKSTDIFAGCRFGEGFVHSAGDRAGSHVCGKDGRLATPVSGTGRS